MNGRNGNVVPVHPQPVQGRLEMRKTSASPADGFKSTPAFQEIKSTVEKEGDKYVKKVKGIICFHVNKGPGGKSVKWVIDLKNGSGKVELNSDIKPECTLTMADADLFDLMTGKLNSNSAFFSGKLKISGNMGLAMKIGNILPTKSKL